MQDLLGDTNERRPNEGSHDAPSNDMLDDLPPDDGLFENQSGNEDSEGDSEEEIEPIFNENGRPRRGTGNFHFNFESIL